MKDGRSDSRPGSSRYVKQHNAFEDFVIRDGDQQSVFGFLPGKVFDTLKGRTSTDAQHYSVRMTAIEEVRERLQKTSARTLFPHLGPFIKFLGGLLADTNFTILLTTLQSFGDVVDLVESKYIKPHLRHILPRVIDKFGENKVVIRQINKKLFSNLMQQLTPGPIMGVLLTSMNHESWHVRLEVINLMIYALLKHPNHSFDYLRIVVTLICGIDDPQPKVKRGSLEALACVHYCLGGQKLFQLMEETNISPDQLAAVKARIESGTLPTASEDGVIQSNYVAYGEDASCPASSSSSLTYTASVASKSPVAGAYSVPRTPQNQIPFVRHPAAAMPRKLPFAVSPASATPGPGGGRLAKRRPMPLSVDSQYDADFGSCPTTTSPTSINYAGSTAPNSRRSWELNASTKHGRRSDKALMSPESNLSSANSPYPFNEAASPPSTPSPDGSPRSSTQSLGTPHLEEKVQLWLPFNNEDIQEDDEEYADDDPTSKPTGPGLATSDGASPCKQRSDSDPLTNRAHITSKLKNLKSKNRSSRFGTRTITTTLKSDNDNQSLQGRVSSAPAYGGHGHNLDDNSLFTRTIGKDLEGQASTPGGLNSCHEVDEEGADFDAVPEQPSAPKPQRKASRRTRTKLKDADFPASAFGGADVSYPDSAALARRPYSAPQDAERAMQALSKGMRKTEDWSAWFDSLTSFRRLCLCHTAMLAPHLRGFMGDLKASVESLRSSLAKHGLMCFTDIFNNLGGHIEKADIDIFLQALLKRAAESNTFLREEAHKALGAMIKQVHSKLCFASLVQNCNTGSHVQKSTSVLFLDECIQVHGSKVIQSRDYARSVKTLTTLMTGQMPETRMHSKRAILHLAKLDGIQAFERTAKSNLTPQQFLDMKKFLDKGLDQNLIYSSSGRQTAPSTDGPSTGYRRNTLILRPQLNRENTTETARASSPATTLVKVNMKVQTQPSRARRAKPARQHSANFPELDQLPSHFSDLMANEWLRRKSGLNRLILFMEEHPTATRHAIVKIFDHFAPLLNDNNRKVQLAALKDLEKMIFTQEGLEEVSNILIPSLAHNLATNNLPVKKLSMELIVRMADFVDLSVLLPALSTTTLYGKTAGKSDMVTVLADVSCNVYDREPQLVENHVLSTAVTLLSEVKGDIRAATANLWKTLHGLMGEKIFAKIKMSESQTKAVKKILED